MANETDVIREFLVKLGFTVNEAGARKFTSVLNTVTKDALKVTGSLVAATVAVEVFVNKMSQAGEALYFMSQRTGAAATNIQGFGYAASQLGGNVEDANSALEAMGQFLRYNPAGESFLNSIKVQTRDANGGLLDTTKIMSNLGKQLAQMPPYLQKVYADFLHISDIELRALTSGDYDKYLADHAARVKAAGVDMDDLTRKGHDFEVKWRNLVDDTTIFGEKLESILIGPAKGLLETVDKIVRAMEHPIDTWEKIKPIVREQTPEEYKKTGDSVKEFLFGGHFWQDIKDDFNSITIKRTDEPAPNAPAKPAPLGDKQEVILQTLTGMGWTQQQAAGILANLKAESNLDPSRTGDSGKAYGIAQWHADRQQDFRNFAGKDIHQSTLDEQLRFLNWELNHTESASGDALRATTDARTAGAVVTGYERPRDFSAQSSLRSEDADRIYRSMQSSAPVINQTTNITVNGSSNPQETADTISRHQRSVNEDLTRNFATAAM